MSGGVAAALRLVGALALAVALPVGAAAPAAAAPRAHPLEITTVPPIPGAQFALDGQVLVADGQGVARALVPPSPTPHRVEVRTATIQDHDLTSRFVRWHGQDDVEHAASPVLDGVRMNHRLRLHAVFEQSRSVHFAFVDQAHRPVDVARVTSVTLRSDTNRTQSFAGAATVELVTEHAGAGDGPPVAKEAMYSLQSVTIDGANVVNVGEQRFRPSQDDPVLDVVVLLRSVHLRVQDRLVGRPVATTVRLVYPDGTVHDLPTDANGELVVQNVARGTYTVLGLGQAYGVAQKVALSRSQFVDVDVVTWLDVAVVGGSVLILLVALLWVGAVRARRHRAARRAEAAGTAAPSEPEGTPEGAPAAATEGAPATPPEPAGVR